METYGSHSSDSDPVALYDSAYDSDSVASEYQPFLENKKKTNTKTQK